MVAEQRVIDQTECWVKTVVIGCNFCPFAKREVDRGAVRYHVVDEEEIEACLQAVIDECLLLDSKRDISTSLLIFPNSFDEFDDYLSLLALSEALMEQHNYQGVYQLASFHPRYQFAETDTNDAANYTNRSPYPMLHLLREADMAKALQNYPQPEQIPERNIGYARAKGEVAMRKMLDACREGKA